MKTKLEMAHEWYMMQVRRNGCALVTDAWKYADAMQAEADKRGEEEIDKWSDELSNILKLSKFKPLELQPDSKEWQPDWSQAPEWANFLVMSFKGTSYWHSSEPRPSGAGWVDGGHCDLAHLDCYHGAGDWRDSLRKRPN